LTQEVVSVVDIESLQQFIGVSSGQMRAVDAVEPGSVRKFVQAIMDEDPIYWDDEVKGATQYGGLVAPYLYPAHMLRRYAGTPDPLDCFADNEDFDGLEMSSYGLPPLPLPYSRALNGGGEVEFYSLANHGDQVFATSRYADVQVREGSTGQMIFVTIETTYAKQTGQLLEKVRETLVWR
jgi:acyl dehydratase